MSTTWIIAQKREPVTDSIFYIDGQTNTHQIIIYNNLICMSLKWVENISLSHIISASYSSLSFRTILTQTVFTHDAFNILCWFILWQWGSKQVYTLLCWIPPRSRRVIPWYVSSLAISMRNKLILQSTFLHFFSMYPAMGVALYRWSVNREWGVMNSIHELYGKRTKIYRHHSVRVVIAVNRESGSGSSLRYSYAIDSE